MSILQVYCANCREHILQADTETLSYPLVGSMFKVKDGMEWSIFSPSDMGNDLTCPLCGWKFHNDDSILTADDIFELKEEAVCISEDEKVQSIFDEYKKKGPKGRK